jgi:hypothetical protein
MNAFTASDMGQMIEALLADKDAVEKAQDFILPRPVKSVYSSDFGRPITVKLADGSEFVITIHQQGA